jgi:hypothetical protein
MPPSLAPSMCEDSATWQRNRREDRDCDWVGGDPDLLATRCALGEEGLDANGGPAGPLAQVHCRLTCGECSLPTLAPTFSYSTFSYSYRSYSYLEPTALPTAEPTAPTVSPTSSEPTVTPYPTASPTSTCSADETVLTMVLEPDANQADASGWFPGTELVINGVPYSLETGLIGTACVPFADCYELSWTTFEDGQWDYATSWEWAVTSKKTLRGSGGSLPMSHFPRACKPTMQPTVMQTQSPTFPVLATQEEKIECFRGLGEFEGTTDFCGRCCSECVAITEIVSSDDAAARDTCVCADMTLTRNQFLYLSDHNDCARVSGDRAEVLGMDGDDVIVEPPSEEAGKMYLSGGLGNDRIFAAGYKTTLNGLKGDDYVIAAGYRNTLWGGDGTGDVCVDAADLDGDGDAKDGKSKFSSFSCDHNCYEMKDFEYVETNC